jgi:hypothetical protein
VSYSAARISKGFEDLLSLLRKDGAHEDVGARIRANTAAREAAMERVRQEYAAYGLKPPCELALSITARKEFGIGIVWVQPEEQVA